MSSKYTITIDKLEENSSQGMILGSIRSGSTVLECGSASGYMTRYMKEQLSAKVSIVELDEEAFHQAREFAEDGICADLDKNEWYDYYQGQQFDYILFADVLEHLRDPQLALRRAADLLNEDGTVIVSIPNVAHADILINLLNNRWNYTPLGLLDNTHIHFWAAENLQELFDKAGLIPVEKDYAIIPPYMTEQKNRDRTDGFESAIHTICKRPFSDVYQFVFKAQREEHVKASGKLCIDRYEERHLSYGKEPTVCALYRENQDKKEDKLTELKENLAKEDRQIESLLSLLEIKEKDLMDLKEKMENQQAELNYFRDSFHEVENAFFWKITRPARLMLDIAKGKRRNKHTKEMLREDNGNQQGEVSFSEWMSTPLFTDDELSNQRRHRFSKDITFSITVPLYNTPEAFLREMIRSVIGQTYSKWELCLADGSDSKHDYVGNVCKEYVARDKRVLYRKLKRNQGISGNTNACLDMATGDYIALFDHDDILHPAALHEMMRVICESDADIVYTDEAVFISPDIGKISDIHFKPDYAPDNLRANNYMCHLTTFRRSLLDKTGGFRSEYDGSQDHDMMLRLTEAAERIEHIPEVLYFWRAHPQSAASGIEAKEYAAVAGRKAVMDSLRRQGFEAAVESTNAHPCIYRIRYALMDTPPVSIVIPNCDHVDELKKCIDSIQKKSTYCNYEIIIAENNSRERKTFDYYDSLAEKHDNIRVVTWKGDFNYSAINNYAVRNAVRGEYILLLNNDTEVITSSWIEEMLMFARRGDVGAVGAMLYYPNGAIQHAGVILGMSGLADHTYQGEKPYDFGYMGRLAYAQNVTAVTAACMMVRRDVWEEAGGLDEEYAVAFNDTDLCMKIRKAGYLIVWTPYAELYHYESLSRGADDTLEKQARCNTEIELFRSKWGAELDRGDPYYNPNLTLEKPDFSLRYTRQRANAHR